MAQPETEPIGQLLLERGWISAEQLSAALERQSQLGGRLGTALLEIGALSEDRLLKTLAKQSGFPPADIADLRDIPQSVLDLLPAKVAIRHQAIPFRTGRGRVDLLRDHRACEARSSQLSNSSAIRECSNRPCDILIVDIGLPEQSYCAGYFAS